MKRTGRKPRFGLSLMLKVAAILILVVLSSLWIIEKTGIITGKKQQPVITLKEVSPEYAEIEIYYTSAINNKLDELDKSSSNGKELRVELMNKEFRELDSLYRSLHAELKVKQFDERIIDAMINYYRTKLEILNKIIEQVNYVKQLKNNEDEKSKIISDNHIYRLNGKIPFCRFI